ncbi:MAG: AraC family transcriptional regulator, partial [Myxococcota bacterium]
MTRAPEDEGGVRRVRAFPPVACGRTGIDPRTLATTLLVTATVRNHVRPAMVGPVSLFTNRSGSSRVQLDGTWLPLRPGAVAVVAAGQEFSLEYGERGAEVLHLHFDPRLVNELGSPVRPGLRRQPEGLRSALGRLDAAARGSEPEGLALETLVTGVLGLAHGHRPWPQTSARTLRPATRAEHQRRIGRVLDFVHAHYNEPLELARLARVACLSRFHFLRCFQDVTGTNPASYVRRVRLDEATVLLEDPRVPIDDVARTVGYGSASSLSRALWRHRRVR